MSVGIEGPTAQAMSTSFELRGNIDRGDLTLTSPVGTVLAQARWDGQGVRWQTAAETLSFTNLDAMALHLTGTTLPFAALLDWLRGVPTQSEGWQVSLQDYDQGRISARRVVPPPAAQLRVVLDR